MLAGRARVAGWYRAALDGIEGLGLPCEDSGGDRRGWFVFVVQVPRGCDRDEAVLALRARGVQSKPYLPAIHLMSFYRERFGHREGEFPVCEDVAARSLALPFFPEMTAVRSNASLQLCGTCSGAARARRRNCASSSAELLASALLRRRTRPVCALSDQALAGGVGRVDLDDEPAPRKPAQIDRKSQRLAGDVFHLLAVERICARTILFVFTSSSRIGKCLRLTHTRVDARFLCKRPGDEPVQDVGRHSLDACVERAATAVVVQPPAPAHRA